ncbi:MAG: hypothetical protein ACJ8BW_25125 [Ktedonobacteraceae bacterium]
MTGIDNTDGDLPREAGGASSEQARAATHVPMTEEQMRGCPGLRTSATGRAYPHRRLRP